MRKEFEAEWYRRLSWLAEGAETLAKEAADACFAKAEFMDGLGMERMEPGTELLVKLFLLLDIMDDEELRDELERLKSRFADVYEMRNKPWLYAQRGMEDEDEEVR